ncbi:hypothetical protein [Singulisphaera sp. PoT]|uniref:hypothetical protein n=1 Tax=Singulisphaera sp. PoT TaxID=3411797 RepID=UPI003BF4A96B
MRPKRHLTLADLMILVVAMAIGSLILRPYMAGFRQQLSISPSLYPGPQDPWRLLAWAQGPGSCFVIPCMAAMVVIRLRNPRPRLFQLQPGFVACAVTLIALLPGIAWILTIQHRPGFQRATGFEQIWTLCTYWVDTAVPGAWFALYLSRRWRPEASWVDRTGRALGLYWIVQLAAWYLLMTWPGLRGLISKWTG